MEEKYMKKWEKIVEELKKTMPDNLVQVAVFNYESSEIGNLVIVLKNDSLEKLASLRPVIQKVIRQKLPTPLIISQSYVEYSLDSFPLEFLNIKTDYSNLFAEKDIFEKLQFEKKYIRLEMERELKSKMLLIKTAVMENWGNPKVLKQIITLSIISIESILKGLLFLLDEDIPKEDFTLLKKADAVTNFDISSFSLAVKYSKKLAVIEKKDLLQFFSTYIKQLNSFSEYVEKELVKNFN